MAQPAEPDKPAYPVDMGLRGAQAVMHVTQPLTELVQQTRSPQWRRSHGGDFVGSVGSAYEYGISEFPNVIKCLSEWVKLCWSATQCVGQQIRRLWLDFRGLELAWVVEICLKISHLHDKRGSSYEA